MRSGKYKQGTGNLKRNNLFCCLGVLVEIGGAQALGKTAIIKTKNVESKIIMRRLINMNDFKMWSFARIANWIESNL